MHLIKELTVPHWNQITEIRENNSRILHPVQIMNLQVLIKTPINVKNVFKITFMLIRIGFFGISVIKIRDSNKPKNK